MGGAHKYDENHAVSFADIAEMLEESSSGVMRQEHGQQLDCLHTS